MNRSVRLYALNVSLSTFHLLHSSAHYNQLISKTITYFLFLFLAKTSLAFLLQPKPDDDGSKDKRESNTINECKCITI